MKDLGYVDSYHVFMVNLHFRCDASIAKLSGDTNIIRHEMQKQEKEIHAIQSTLENYTNNMDMKVSRSA